MFLPRKWRDFHRAKAGAISRNINFHTQMSGGETWQEMSPRSANHLPTIENAVNIKLLQKEQLLLPWEEVHRTEFVRSLSIYL